MDELEKLSNENDKLRKEKEQSDTNVKKLTQQVYSDYLLKGQASQTPLLS